MPHIINGIYNNKTKLYYIVLAIFKGGCNEIGDQNALKVHIKYNRMHGNRIRIHSYGGKRVCVLCAVLLELTVNSSWKNMAK